MSVNAVLVEFDGVVADTFAIRKTAFAHALADINVRMTDEEYWEHCAGWPTNDGVRGFAQHRKLHADESELAVLTHKIDAAIATAISKGLIMRDGASAALERLSSRARLAIVTSMRRTDVEAILSMSRLESLFAFVVAEEDVYPGKPNPAPYRAALERCGRFRHGKPGQVVALEFGIAGIRSARAAGVACVAVGEQPAHIVLEADAYLPNMSGLDHTSLDALITQVDPS